MTLRSTIKDEELKVKMSAVYNIFAFVILVVLLMILPKYTDSLHPGKGDNPGFNEFDLDKSLRLAFYPAVVGWMLLGTWMYLLSVRFERVKGKIRTKLEY
jgi:heme exporter protein C